MIDIMEAMESLACKRPIFHSEADFQHALSWEMHLQKPASSFRLEYRPRNIEDRIYLDVWGANGDSILAMELKYKTRKLRVDIDKEVFELLDQSAQDLGRYDFIKDIGRLEQVISGMNNAVGYALLLTNDRSYWKASAKNDTVDSDFRLHESRILSGELAWSPNAATGTTKGREKPITLEDSYTMSWRDYSTLSLSSYGKFRYLLVEIGNKS